MTFKPPTVRMYVDENGHQTLKGDLTNNSNRFLCLTGAIMLLKEHDNLTGKMNELKIKCLGNTGIVLHRRELISAKPPFECLNNHTIRAEFDSGLLDIIRSVRYRVVSVVIDKKAHLEKYGVLRAQDPYAVALEYLMQRYQYWMQEYCIKAGHCYGDILAESRGGGEDKTTKQAYIEIYNGRGFKPLKNASQYYSSGEIKLKPKSANVAGLQLVDILSHAARRYILSLYNLADNISQSSFEQQIVEILVNGKFRRRNNHLEGAGIKLFPG